MTAEFNNSPEQNPLSLHDLKTHELRKIAADTQTISLLHEIHTVALRKAIKNEFDTNAAELVLFVRIRIEEVQNEKVNAETMDLRTRHLAEQGERLEQTFSDDLRGDIDKQIEEVLKLFSDEK